MGFLALVSLGIGLAWPDQSGTPLTGRAVAVDGDTLRLGPVRLRLIGLDAPELDQTCTRADGTQWRCGLEAKEALASRLAAGPVQCDRHGHDVYGRVLGRCTAGNGDLGAELVRSGWAVSTDAYIFEAAAARAQQLGIWSGNFDLPAAWRRDHEADQPGPWQWIRSWFQ
jgi:endonuclease YncB( thermonuclease family)